MRWTGSRRANAALVVVIVVTPLVVGAGNIVRHESGASPEAAASPAPTTAVGAARELLPDLDQEPPSELQVRQVVRDGEVGYRLGFRSAVGNVGDGPLIVRGARPNTSTQQMKVDQLIERSGAAPRVRHDVGRMEYSVSPDHSHWHYLQFERYELQRSELRRSGSREVLVADRKTGFCLGDRFRVSPVPRHAAVSKVYRSRCGLSRPDLLQIEEGISVGFGDAYSAFLEGQDLPLDGLSDGRYVLVHRVNVGAGLEEVSYANNAASLLLDLRWHGGQPEIRIVATCPDTDRCDG